MLQRLNWDVTVWMSSFGWEGKMVSNHLKEFHGVYYNLRICLVIERQAKKLVNKFSRSGILRKMCDVEIIVRRITKDQHGLCGVLPYKIDAWRWTKVREGLFISNIALEIHLWCIENSVRKFGDGGQHEADVMLVRKIHEAAQCPIDFFRNAREQ